MIVYRYNISIVVHNNRIQLFIYDCFCDYINALQMLTRLRRMATHLFGPDVGHKQRVLVHSVRLGGRPYGGEDHHHYQRDQISWVRDRLHDAAAAVVLTYGRDQRERDRKIPPRRPVVHGRLRRSATTTKRAIPVTIAYWSATARLVQDGDRANHVRTPAITYTTSPPRAPDAKR